MDRASVFGILGIVISGMVFLSPVPTFYKVYKNKSSEGILSLPYILALCSSTLWIYYSIVKKEPLVFFINCFGCLVEPIYIVFFLLYASKKSRLITIILLFLLNVCGYGAMVLSTHYLTPGSKRLDVIGCICLVFNIGVFASPLSVLRRVITTKNVESMPFTLSFLLTINATMWFFYGLLIKDPFITLPNMLGFLFGIIQMVVYLIYRKGRTVPPNGPVVNGVP